MPKMLSNALGLFLRLYSFHIKLTADEDQVINFLIAFLRDILNHISSYLVLACKARYAATQGKRDVDTTVKCSKGHSPLSLFREASKATRRV